MRDGKRQSKDNIERKSSKNQNIVKRKSLWN